VHVALQLVNVLEALLRQGKTVLVIGRAGVMPAIAEAKRRAGGEGRVLEYQGVWHDVMMTP
jgi:hypothetical protein